MVYTVVCDWAGVRNNRAAYFDNFGDANRAAMDGAVKHGKRVSVYDASGEPVACYERGESGLARVCDLPTARGPVRPASYLHAR